MPECNDASIGRSTFTVELTDDRGKVWRGTISVPEILTDGSGFGDPNR